MILNELTFFIGNKIDIIVVYSGLIKKEFYLLENSVNFKDEGWQTALYDLETCFQNGYMK